LGEVLSVTKALSNYNNKTGVIRTVSLRRGVGCP
jgi:hypothetical protein